jgi:hypothetical protein
MITHEDETMKFLCLAYEEESKLRNLSKHDWQVLRSETLTYVDELRKKNNLISAEPLRSVETAVTVRIRNGKRSVTDGPFAETKEQLGGFFLIEAANLDEAIRIAAGWPSARIGSIEVRPIEPGLNEETRYR